MELTVLVICGALTITASLMVVFACNTVHSAIWMVASCCLMAILYLLLRAEFIAILQIIIYAGAIMMFIIYAIMMLNVRREEENLLPLRKIKVAGLGLLSVLFLLLVFLITGRGLLAIRGPVTDELMEKFGHVAVLSNSLFSDYLLPFETVSLLLTAGVVGSVILARRK